MRRRRKGPGVTAIMRMKITRYVRELRNYEESEGDRIAAEEEKTQEADRRVRLARAALRRGTRWWPVGQFGKRKDGRAYWCQRTLWRSNRWPSQPVGDPFLAIWTEHQGWTGINGGYASMPHGTGINIWG